MKLNIEKLKDKLNNISSEVSYKIEKKFHTESKHYFNVITFNNLIQIYVDDREDIKSDIDSFNYFVTPSFRIEDFFQLKNTLDFIQSNEQVIKNAMLESIE